MSSVNKLDLPAACGITKIYMNAHLVACQIATESRVD